MRRVLAFSGVVLSAAALGWVAGRMEHGRADLQPPPPNHSTGADVSRAGPRLLDPGFRAGEVEAVRDRFGTSVSRLDFAGKTFWLIVLPYGDGVPYTVAGLYAPTGAGTYSLCLEAESCGAGWVKPELDPETGVLQLREHARSRLEGQVILACNLRSTGTEHSVPGK